MAPVFFWPKCKRIKMIKGGFEMDYKKTAADILKYVGDENNVIHLGCYQITLYTR